VSHYHGELTLSDELREQLGIAEDDSARLLHAGARVMLLERVRASDGEALPWDRDLVLTASVQSFPMADILSMLHRAGKSGFLQFGSEDHEKAVYLQRGEVVFASSNQDVDRLGECLFRGGMITMEDLRYAKKRWSPTCRFGKVLVERGALTPRELWNGVKFQVEEIVRSLFAYTTGSVHFWEGDVQPDNVVRLSLPTARLITEGLKRRDELLRFLAALEESSVRLEPAGGSEEGLSGNSRLFLGALKRDPRFSSACREAGLDPRTAARTVQMLRLAGAVKVSRQADGAGPEKASGSASEGQEALRELVMVHVKLMTELSAPLVAMDGPDAVRERIMAVMEDVAGRYPELFEGLELGAAGMFDPEEVTARALRIPADRERKVLTALGELVIYLEFELQNHPRIEDADTYLEAIEPLRAMLDA
jgi:hypothetical protein